ncbi:MAG: hypothetical protein GY850_22680, partial [bacterium]|nr:hypothetical protein [bacterium]
MHSHLTNRLKVVVTVLLFFIPVGTGMLFAASDLYLVKDINHSGGSSLRSLTALNGALFFVALDDSGEYGLWRSDGTEGGTKKIEKINGYVWGLVVVDELLFFFVTTSFGDGSYGRALWKSDGTEAGTVFVNNFSEYGQFSICFTAVQGRVFFSFSNSREGWDLWKSDGTEQGTVMVKSMRPVENGYICNFLDVDGELYFSANDGVHGTELWQSDGTDNGTRMVKDIRPNRRGSGAGPAAKVNGTLLFFASDAELGSALWKSDGTEAGTVKIKEINSSEYALVESFVADNDTLYFSASDDEHGWELWKSDGTANGTVMVRDINPFGDGVQSMLELIINIDGMLYFTADDGVHGVELWKSDGTEAGTVMVKDVNPGAGRSQPFFLTKLNDRIYFGADDGVHGWELWRSDGTAAGTGLVKDFDSAWGTSPSYLTYVNDILFLSLDDGIHGTELWALKDPYDPGLQPTVWYADNGTTGADNGTSWAAAFGSLQAAVAAASDFDEIWVRRGTYALDAPLVIDKPVALSGGFAGNESFRYQRNVKTNACIIDGKGTAECFTVTDNATLDGFTIAGGRSGMQVVSGSVDIANCILRDNWSESGNGGAISCTGGDRIRVVNSTFFNNHAGQSGGAISIAGGTAHIENCIFWDNQALKYGGAVFARDADVRLVNCTFTKNKAESAGGMYSEDSRLELINCILWRDLSDGMVDSEIAVLGQDEMNIQYCNIDQDGYAGVNGTIRRDPIFWDIQTGQLRLQEGSPCIDAGTSVNASLSDMEGKPRFDDLDSKNTGGGEPDYYDMGAYEFIWRHDLDQDQSFDFQDNCPTIYNPDQKDADADGFGDVCDRGDRFAVADTVDKKIYVYNVDNVNNFTLVAYSDLSVYGTPGSVYDAGSSGWFVKVSSQNNLLSICHIDSSGALRNVYSFDRRYPGSVCAGLRNGGFVVGDVFVSEIQSNWITEELIISVNVWNDPDGWNYDYTLLGDPAGLIGGGFVVPPESGAEYLCGVGPVEGADGFTPYLYFYTSGLFLYNKVDISPLGIQLFSLDGLPDGGFVATGNEDGGQYISRLFFFDAGGSLIKTKDISGDIPGLDEACYDVFQLSAAGDGTVMLARHGDSKVWVYNAEPAVSSAAMKTRRTEAPMMIDLAKDGVVSIGGIGGSVLHGSAIQMGLVRGMITDRDTSSPVGGAAITTDGNAAPAVSFADGSYQVMHQCGTYTLSVRADGYDPWTSK